ncbi:hypothetical protein [Corynebacterium aquilae]|uniref:hypothetical protein n=1 Tax=Corynebacterium aquilae TaxID=203263 RepID=UPI000952FE01|nr:hypothetical protein [Corynebacterium aquilae]
MANRKYSAREVATALKKYDELKSMTKTVRALGYPGRWTLHKWVRERNTPKEKPFRHKHLSLYPFEVKLQAAKMYQAGDSPASIADKLQIRSKRECQMVCV